MEHTILMNATQYDYWNSLNFSYDYVYDEYIPTEQIFMHEKNIIISIILGVVVLLSLVGNILVVVISVFYTRLRSLISIFILNLALSDLLFTVYLPFWVCDLIWRLDLGKALCKGYMFFFSVGFYSNMMLLVLMSVQRYMTMVNPLTGWKKARRVAVVLISSWVISILVAFRDAMHHASDSYSGGCTYSSYIIFVAIIYKEIIFFLCAFVFMAFIYIRILQNIFKSTTNQGHKTTGLAFTLVATYFVSWAPYHILHFLDILNYHQIYVHGEYFGDAADICYILARARCCLNPLIYGLFGLKFRENAREIFQRRPTLNPAQMGMEEVNSDSYVNLNN